MSRFTKQLTRSLGARDPFTGASMKWLIAILGIFLALFQPSRLLAQSDQDAEVNWGGYTVHQSIEFGAHVGKDVAGNPSVYDTFVDLHDGPRLLDYQLNMRSLTNTGTLFDNLSISSFGFGGEPENVARLRMNKSKWYDFTAMFRRDVNNWDFNQLANPFNPANPYIAVNNTPHQLELRRKMGDFNLTLLPDSRVSFRLGYSRNVNEGPALMSYHEGTDVLLFRDYRARLDSYRAGVEVELFKGTKLSFDQFLDHDKTDMSTEDENFTFQLANGTPVDAGLPYDPVNNQPCANAFTPGNPPVLNARCNGYFGYSQTGPTRMTTPTEQLTWKSIYKRFEFTAQGYYTAGDNDLLNFNEEFNGLVMRTNERAYTFSGPATTRRVAAGTDFTATVHVNDQFRISDTFRWLKYSVPGAWFSEESAQFAPITAGTLLQNPVIYDPANPGTCVPPGFVGCPAHTNSSPADVASEVLLHNLKENSKYNTVLAEFDPLPFFGVRAGYRIGKRSVHQSEYEYGVLTFYPGNATRGGACTDVDPVTGICTEEIPPPTSLDDYAQENWEITQNSVLAGFWATPLPGLRFNGDVEYTHADHALTRISPTDFTSFKLRGSYKLRRWFNLGGSINVLQGSNDDPDENAGFPAGIEEPERRQHARTYSLNFGVTPREWLSLNLGWSYGDVFSITGNCFTAGTQNPAGITACAAPNVPSIWKYQSNVQSGSFGLYLKPVSRVTAMLGYEITSVSGNDPSVVLRADTGDPYVYNNRIPYGATAFNWHRPSASLAVEVVKHWTMKGGWNYYDYNEKGSSGLDPVAVAPRDFHATLGTVSLKYEF